MQFVQHTALPLGEFYNIATYWRSWSLDFLKLRFNLLMSPWTGKCYFLFESRDLTDRVIFRRDSSKPISHQVLKHNSTRIGGTQSCEPQPNLKIARSVKEPWYYEYCSFLVIIPRLPSAFSARLRETRQKKVLHVKHDFSSFSKFRGGWILP